MNVERLEKVTVTWPSNIRLPKFAIGQQVKNRFQIDDEADEYNGQWFEDFGVIVGIVFNHPDYRLSNSWWYYVYFTRGTCPGQETCFPITDCLEEFKLEAL